MKSNQIIFDIYQIFLPRPFKRNHFGIKIGSYQPLKPEFLLNTRKTYSSVKIFSKIKTILLKHPDVLLTSC